MRIAPTIQISEDDRKQLEKWARGRSTPHKIVLRAKIVLMAVAGKKSMEIAEELGTSEQTVCLWRQRFSEGGIAGIEKDATRPGRNKQISDQQVQAVVDKTMNSKPLNATHWSVRSMAAETGFSTATIHRIWKEHNLKPHLIETFKFSNDPRFTEKLQDVVGLYMNPPDKALVFSFDEKSQIQALDRTQLQLPLRPGIPARQTHDYKRNGTTTLFAALNILDGTIVSDCMPRHRHQEFLKFLNKLDRETPAHLELHLILDNYATHTHQKVQSWLKRHKRFHFHFTPTSSSWLNLIERWFKEITDKQIRRGTFQNVDQLIATIEDFIANHNDHPTKFIWSAPAERILQKIAKLKEV
jgi:transposase